MELSFILTEVHYDSAHFLQENFEVILSNKPWPPVSENIYM